jgi:hypothetical protein
MLFSEGILFKTSSSQALVSIVAALQLLNRV